MVERRTEQEISVKEPHSRRLQAKDRSDPAFLDNRSLIPAETALSSLLDHMHVTRTSYTSVQGKDLPRRFQTKEDEFVGMFVARGAIELRTADGPWVKGGKASYFLISRRIEFDIRTPRPSECGRSEEHTPELQSLIRIYYAVCCL